MGMTVGALRIRPARNHNGLRGGIKASLTGPLAIIGTVNKAAETPRQRMKPEVRRESLLQAAASVFAERGYEAARIEQVADAADVSPGLLYRHFAGKKELYSEALQRADTELLDHMSAGAAPGQPSHSRLEYGVDAVLAFIEERPVMWRLLVRDVVDPEIKELRDATYAHAVSVVAAQLEIDPEFQRQDFTAEETGRIAAVIVGATTAMADWWTNHPGARRQEVLATIMSMMWLGFDRMRSGERYQVDLTRD
jgi:AcrR family transcriptional regulator